MTSARRVALAAIAMMLVSSVSAEGCHHDNLFRCMNSNALAGPYCISYDMIPAVTVTVTTSILPQITPSKPPTAASGISTPECIPSGNSPYLQSLISSVCGCISLPTPTNTIYTTIAPTSTSTFPTTTSTSASGGSNDCTPSAMVTYRDATYAQYHRGSGYRENEANPGNGAPDVFPPASTVFAGPLNACEAVQSCTEFTFGQSGIYLSFALYLLQASQEWECVAYWNSNEDPTYFDILDENVAVGYGYSIQDL